MTTEKRGRGVAAVISGTPALGNFLELPLNQISPNQNQPRKEFEDDALKTLIDSIKLVGILQPILVRKIKQNEYEIIAGERRYRASKAAGLASIPAVVRSVENKESLEQALAENLHRVELNPLEEAAAFKSLIDDFGLSQEEVAKQVQKSRAAIANTIRLTGLPAPVQKLISDGLLSAGHARAILSIVSSKSQISVAQKAVKDGWSVRKLEEFAKQNKSKSTPTIESRPAALIELENLLKEHLATKVTIQIGAKNKGKVQVEFYGLEDLERIFRKMQGS